MKYIVIIVLFFFSSPAKAGFHMGSSIIATGSKNISPTYNIGYSKLFSDDWVLDSTTNILFPAENKVRIRGFAIEQEITHISLLLGKKFKGFVPSIIVSAVKVDNSVFLGNINVSREKTHALVFGGNLNYPFITNKIAVSAFFLLPNTNIDLKLSSGFGFSYYF